MSGYLIAGRPPSIGYSRVQSRWGKSKRSSSHIHMVRATSLNVLHRLLICLYKGDHIFGLLPLMASRLNGAGGTSEGVDDPRSQLGEHQEVSLNACFITRF